MSNKKENLPANVTSLLGNLAAAQKATPAPTDGNVNYLKMDKAGHWVYGADENEVDADSSFIINPESYESGYICWKDGELVGEEMAVAGERQINQSELPDTGSKWDAQVGFTLTGVEGPEEGVVLQYKTSSRGGKQAISELLTKILAKGAAGSVDICPIVELDCDFYKHKQYGKVYTPVLDVVEWVEIPESSTGNEVEEEVEEVEKEETPKRRRRKAS